MKRLLIIWIFGLICLTGETLAAKAPGYVLYGVQNASTAALLDTNGNTYKTWTFSSSAKNGYSMYMMSGGVLVRTVTTTTQLTGGGITGRVQKVDWNGNVIWDYTYSSSTYCLHHDICPMPNGNVLLISYDVRSAAEATAAGCSQNMIIWADKIIEVQPTGATTGDIVWEWKAWDHLCQNYNSAKSNYVTSISEHPELLNINYATQTDWMHMNGVDYNPTLDQIAFSSHYLNEIFVIDHSTTTAQAASHSGGNSGKGGDLLYRWGNPAAYGMTGTKILNVVHDAHFVEAGFPNAGYLVAFNNNGVSSSQSSIDLVSPPYSGYNFTFTAGSPYTPASYTQRVACSGHSNNMGSSQQLSNGNMLICIAQSGLIYEIDPSGTTVWTKSISGIVPKAQKYTAAFLGITVNTVSVTASANKTSICLGDSVQLSATPSGAASYVYEWTSSPAGFTSGLQSPVVYPTQNTTYNLIVRNAANLSDTAIATKYVTVVNPPAASITVNGSSKVCSGDSVALNVAFASGQTYAWQKNGVLISGNNTNTLYAKSAGTYKVVVTNSTGCSATSSDMIIEVIDKPSVTLNASNDIYLIAGETAELSANASAAAELQWKKDGVALAGATSSSLTVNTSGNYKIVASNSNGCKDSTNSIKVTVYPKAKIMLEKSGIFCDGDSILIYSDVYTGAEYSWYKDYVKIENENSAKLRVNKTGAYVLHVNYFNNRTDSSNSITAVAQTLPLAKITAKGLTSIQSGDSVLLEAAETVGVSYAWYKDSKLISGKTSSKLYAGDKGIYYCIASNQLGCTQKSNEIEITILPANTAAISCAGANSFCDGDSTIIRANSGTGYEYTWLKDDQIINGAVNSNLTVKESGKYSVIIKFSANYKDTSNVISITVFPIPAKPTIALKNDTLFANYGRSFNWYNESEKLSCITQYFVPSINGKYKVQIIDENGCASDYSEYFEYTKTDVKDNITGTDVYPNPSSGIININPNIQFDEISSVKIYDTLNRLVAEVKASHTLDLRELNSGVYAIYIMTSDGQIQKSFINILK